MQILSFFFFTPDFSQVSGFRKFSKKQTEITREPFEAKKESNKFIYSAFGRKHLEEKFAYASQILNIFQCIFSNGLKKHKKGVPCHCLSLEI